MVTQYFENVTRPEPHAFGDPTSTVVRKLSLSDLSAALRLGWEDFQAMPSHAIILCVIYPILGLVLFRLVLGYSVLPLLFPVSRRLYVDWAFCRDWSLRTQPPPRAR